LARRLARTRLSWEAQFGLSKAGPRWPCPKPSSTNQTSIFWPQ
jgi:hypothetical protein